MVIGTGSCKSNYQITAITTPVQSVYIYVVSFSGQNFAVLLIMIFKYCIFQGFPLHMNLAMTSSNKRLEQNTVRLIKDQNRQLTKVCTYIGQVLDFFF